MTPDHLIESNAMAVYRIRSSDGKILEIDSGIVKQSLYFLEKFSQNSQDILNCPFATASTLQLMFKWCDQHRRDHSSHSPHIQRNSHTTEWDSDFFNSLDHKTLFELILVANFSGTNGLVFSSCTFASEMIEKCQSITY